MGAKRFKIALLDAKHNKKLWREWSGADLMRSVGWLKHMNARGYEVFVAPADEHGLVLLDNLREQMLTSISDKGFEPVATIQISQGLYQAWVKLSNSPLSDEVRQLALSGLKRALGDGSDDGARGQFGRLAGFTCDISDDSEGIEKRFVQVRHTANSVAKKGPAYLDSIRTALEKSFDVRDSVTRENLKLRLKQHGLSR